MPLVQPPEGVSAGQIEQAEALVAAAIGAPTLEEREVTQTGAVRGAVLSLRDGPLTKLTTLSLGGSVMPIPEVHPWHLWLALTHAAYGLVSSASQVTLYSVSYTAGWADEDELPGAIKQAVLLTAQSLAQQAEAGGLTEYRVGDVTEKYAQPQGNTGLPTAAIALLAPWRRLRF